MEAKLQALKDMAEYYNKQGKTLIRATNKQIKIFFLLLNETELTTNNTQAQ